MQHPVIACTRCITHEYHSSKYSDIGSQCGDCGHSWNNAYSKKPSSHSVHPRFNYSKMDRSSIVEFMENLFCQGQWISCTLYTCWKYIKTAILESCNRFIPKLRIPSTLSPRWFNADVRHKLNKVRTLRRRLKSKPTPQLATKLSRTEDLLAVQMQRTKEKFILELTSTFTAQPKRLYSYISSLSSTKPQISSISTTSKWIIKN